MDKDTNFAVFINDTDNKAALTIYKPNAMEIARDIVKVEFESSWS